MAIVPESWRAVLRTIQQKVDKNAIIAGGALRDLDLHRPIADLDILVSEGTSDAKLAEIFNSDITEDMKSFSDSLVKRSYVLDASDFAPHPLEIPLNIIECSGNLREPIDRVPQFDFGLCQTWFDGKGRMPEAQRTPEYREDRVNMRFTLTRCTSHKMLEESLIRYHRFTKKFEGWPLVIPSEYAAFLLPLPDEQK